MGLKVPQSLTELVRSRIGIRDPFPGQVLLRFLTDASFFAFISQQVGGAGTDIGQVHTFAGLGQAYRLV